MDRWTIQYGKLTYLFTDDGTQLVCKVFATVRALLEVMHLTTTMYRSETNAQTERSNSTMFTYLQQYVTKHQKDWATIV